MFNLCYFQDWIESTARELGLSINTVKAQKSSWKKNLERKFEGYFPVIDVAKSFILNGKVGE